MAEERFAMPVDMPRDMPDFVREAEEAKVTDEPLPEQTDQVTIKFGRGLVGELFTSKNGKELVEVSIPNPDKGDSRPWETFVISPRKIHDNQFGKGVWMKLPEYGITRLSRSVKIGIDKAGNAIWGRETHDVTNAQLKLLLEAYKEKSKGSVLSDLSERKADTPSVKPPGKDSKEIAADR